VRRALNSPKRRFPARAEADRYRIVDAVTKVAREIRESLPPLPPDESEKESFHLPPASSYAAPVETNHRREHVEPAPEGKFHATWPRF
jgi:hypothetical protein